ncbi:MAG: SHOCT domain-containing protein [Dehalococcoidia bacterium]
MWGMHDGMGWWMVFGGVWMVLFWGAIIWLIVWSVSRLGGDHGPAREAPMDIARRRLASGEITREEFEQLKHDLA